MRIAYVCLDRGIPILGFKGASVHVREITSALQRRGHEMTVAAVRLGSGNAPPLVAELQTIPEGAREAEISLVNLLRRHRVEAVIERYALESGPARLASRSLGLSLVLEVNSPLVLEAQRFRGLTDVDRALGRERAIFSSAEAITVVSRGLESYVRERAPRGVVHVVRNGVNLSRPLPSRSPILPALPEGAVAIGFIGSMKPWHGVHELLSAFFEVAATRSLTHLIFAGTGPEENLLMERAASSAYAGRVHFLGARPHEEIPSILSLVEIGAAPYRPTPDFYFCPLKIVEYLGAGVPTVYPAIGDLDEIVGNAGVSYAPAVAGSLKAALASLLDDAPRRRALRENALARREEFGWDHSAEQVERLVAAARESTMADGGP